MTDLGPLGYFWIAMFLVVIVIAWLSHDDHDEPPDGW